MQELDYERWSEIPTAERYAVPHRRDPEKALVVNRWGDTAEDQRRRRREIARDWREAA